MAGGTASSAGELVRMVAGRRLVTHLTTGSLVTLTTFATFSAPAPPAAAGSVCPATLLPGEVCAVVETIVGPLVPTTDSTAPSPVPTLPSLPEPLADTPLAPGPTSPVPSPSSPPSNEETAPAPSTPPGAGTASPAPRPAAPPPSSTAASGSGDDRATVAPPVAGEIARGVDLPALIAGASPFVLGPAPVPTATATGSSADGTSELAAVRSLPGDDLADGGLPRPSAPITLAVLLVAGVLGAHGVRWVDRQTASSAASASGVDTGARQA